MIKQLELPENYLMLVLFFTGKVRKMLKFGIFILFLTCFSVAEGGDRGDPGLPCTDGDEGIRGVKGTKGDIDATSTDGTNSLRLVILTSASHVTDGLNRMLSSAKFYNLEVKVLGLGQWAINAETQFEDFTFKRQKLIFLEKEVGKYRSDMNTIILIVDGYDIVFMDTKESMVEKFLKFQANIVFGAEVSCFPLPELADQYPKVHYKAPYLNSGFIMGYAPYMNKMLTYDKPEDISDQGIFSTLYVNPVIRRKLGIKLDHEARLVQNLNHCEGDVELFYNRNETVLVNTLYDTKPSVMHGNGNFVYKAFMNTLANYIPNMRTLSQGCIACREDRIDLANMAKTEYPHVLMGIFIETYTPFLEDVLQKISELVYPKEKIHLYLYNNVEKHEDIVIKWLSKHKGDYSSFRISDSSVKLSPGEAKHEAINLCLAVSCDVFFNVESGVYITNNKTLDLLISYNRSIIGPMMTKENNYWSTFWGAIGVEKEYVRSFDYFDIVDRNIQGFWNVPYISGAYVIWRRILETPTTSPNYLTLKGFYWDQDMAFILNNLLREIFMFVANLEDYGIMIDRDVDEDLCPNNELCHESTNRVSWEDRYLHQDYRKILNDTSLIKEVCPEVFIFPLLSRNFVKDMQGVTYRDFKSESDDERLSKRIFDLVMPDDCLQFQVFDFDPSWQSVLDSYVRPIMNKIYLEERKSIYGINCLNKFDSTTDTAEVINDPSLCTLRVSLSDAGVDFEGGAMEFIRQKCALPPVESGWATIYPGRLTHLYRKPKVTEGTKYEIISLVGT